LRRSAGSGTRPRLLPRAGHAPPCRALCAATLLDCCLLVLCQYLVRGWGCWRSMTSPSSSSGASAAPSSAGIFYACVAKRGDIQVECADSTLLRNSLKAFIDGTVAGLAAQKDKGSFNHGAPRPRRAAPAPAAPAPAPPRALPWLTAWRRPV